MLSFHIKFVQTERRTDRRTDGRTDRQTENGKTICPRYFDTRVERERELMLINAFNYRTMIHARRQSGLGNLRKVSTYVSLRGPFRLTWRETFRNFSEGQFDIMIQSGKLSLR